MTISLQHHFHADDKFADRFIELEIDIISTQTLNEA